MSDVALKRLARRLWRLFCCMMVVGGSGDGTSFGLRPAACDASAGQSAIANETTASSKRSQARENSALRVERL